LAAVPEDADRAFDASWRDDFLARIWETLARFGVGAKWYRSVIRHTSGES
jgi:hypothetical protein